MLRLLRAATAAAGKVAPRAGGGVPAGPVPSLRRLSSRTGGAAQRRVGVQTQTILNEVSTCKTLDALATVMQRNRTELGPITVVAAVRKRAELAAAAARSGIAASGRQAPSTRSWRRALLMQLGKPQHYSAQQLVSLLRDFVEYGEADLRVYDGWARQFLSSYGKRLHREASSSSDDEVRERGATDTWLSPAAAAELLSLGDALSSAVRREGSGAGSGGGSVHGGGNAAQEGVNANYRLSSSLLLRNAGGVAREGAHRLLAAATVAAGSAPSQALGGASNSGSAGGAFKRRASDTDGPSPAAAASATATRLSHSVLFPGATALGAAAAPLCLWTCTNALGRVFQKLVTAAVAASPSASNGSLGHASRLAGVSARALRQELVWNLSTLERRVRRFKEGGGVSSKAAGGNGIARKESLSVELAALRATAFTSPVLDGGLAMTRHALAALLVPASGSSGDPVGRAAAAPLASVNEGADRAVKAADPLGLASVSRASVPASFAALLGSKSSSSSDGSGKAAAAHGSSPLQPASCFTDLSAALAAVDQWVATAQRSMQQEGGYPLPPAATEGAPSSVAADDTRPVSAALATLLDAALLALHAPAVADPVAVRRGGGGGGSGFSEASKAGRSVSPQSSTASVLSALNASLVPAALALTRRFEHMATTMERWAAIRGGDAAEVLPPAAWAAVGAHYAAAGPLLRTAAALRDWAALGKSGGDGGSPSLAPTTAAAASHGPELAALHAGTSAVVEALLGSIAAQRGGGGPLRAVSVSSGTAPLPPVPAAGAKKDGAAAASGRPEASLTSLCARWARWAAAESDAGAAASARAAALVDLAAAVAAVASPVPTPSASLPRGSGRKEAPAAATKSAGPAPAALLMEAAAAALLEAGSSPGTPPASLLLTSVQLADLVHDTALSAGGKAGVQALTLPLRANNSAIQIATGLLCEALEKEGAAAASAAASGSGRTPLVVAVQPLQAAGDGPSNTDDNGEDEEAEGTGGRTAPASPGGHAGSGPKPSPHLQVRVPLQDATEEQGTDAKGHGLRSTAVAAAAARHTSRAQTLLQAAGADVTATGRVAPATAAALSAFRKATGLAGSYALLTAAIAPLSTGRSQGAVRVPPSMYLSLTLPQAEGGKGDKPRFKTLRYGHVVSDPRCLSALRLPHPYAQQLSGSGSRSTTAAGAPEGNLDWYDWSGMFADVDADAASAAGGSRGAGLARVDVAPAAPAPPSAFGQHESASSDDELLDTAAQATTAVAGGAGASPRAAAVVRSAQRLKLAVAAGAGAGASSGGWDSDDGAGSSSDGDVRVLPAPARAAGGGSDDEWGGLSDLEAGTTSAKGSSSDEASDGEGGPGSGVASRRLSGAAASHPPASLPRRAALQDLEDAEADATTARADASAPQLHRVAALPPATALALADLLVLLLTELHAAVASDAASNGAAVKAGAVCLSQLAAALQSCVVAPAAGATAGDAVGSLLQVSLPSFRRVAIRSKAEAVALALSSSSSTVPASPGAQQLLASLALLV